jgi:transcriptional regulator with XRE-family HTH domain
MREEPLSRFADNVSRLAGMHGLSLEQLARLLGLTAQTISLWRSGKRRPSGDALLAVGDLFGIDPVALSHHTFSELMPLLAQPEQYERVEARIAGAKSMRNLKAV